MKMYESEEGAQIIIKEKVVKHIYSSLSFDIDIISWFYVFTNIILSAYLLLCSKAVNILLTGCKLIGSDKIKCVKTQNQDRM